MIGAAIERAKHPATPVLLLPGALAPETYPSLDAMARRVRDLAGGGSVRIGKLGVASLSGHDTLPVRNLYIEGAHGPGLWFASAAIQDRPATELASAIALAGGSVSL